MQHCITHHQIKIFLTGLALARNCKGGKIRLYVNEKRLWHEAQKAVKLIVGDAAYSAALTQSPSLPNQIGTSFSDAYTQTKHLYIQGIDLSDVRDSIGPLKNADFEANPSDYAGLLGRIAAFTVLARTKQVPITKTAQDYLIASFRQVVRNTLAKGDTIDAKVA